MPYTSLKYSLTDVRAAGEDIRRSNPEWADPLELSETRQAEILDIVDNWRAAHYTPLIAFRMNLQRHVRSVGPHAIAPIVAQRIKRLQSIREKLWRLRHFELDEMQDIGGCRAVVKTIEQVRRLRDLHLESRSKHQCCHQDDYLDSKPKPSGYRGIHLIYQYHRPRTSWHGLKTEVQLRTILQHLWSTSNEVVGTAKGEKFKSGEGDKRWLRMFTLIGAAFALVEGTRPIVEAPRTYGPVPTTLGELRLIITALNKEIRFTELVAGYGKGMALTADKKVKDASIFLFELDIETHTLHITPFRDNRTALTAYGEAEKKLRQGLWDICLVSLNDVKNLRRAYPNYYLDTRQFVHEVNKLLI